MAAPFTPAPSPRRRVFISYSRKDGSQAAYTLRDLMLASGCEVWLDTDRISGGASWTAELESALADCQVLLAILTPGSYVSEICRSEQNWALDHGKSVIPVLASGEVPIALYSRNYRKFPEQQAALLSDVLGELISVAPLPRPLRYDTIPTLPQNHVIREKSLTDLRDLVFSEGEGEGSNIAVTAVAGMGGIGKTVLSIALCRDPVVQRAFPDGIAWITIGREWDGDFVTRMREVARALGDDLSGYDNPLASEHRYRTVLRDKAALVVIDDIWDLEHLKPLLVDAPRSRFLFTTRDVGIAKAAANRRYRANLLDQNEARALLSRWSGVALNSLPPEADQIIQQCGELALAVAQVGASLRDLTPLEWRDTLQALQNADISAIEDILPTGQQSFFKSLAVSVETLTPQMRELYLQMAVLLEDEPAPLSILRTLWRSNEAEARRTSRHFVDRSLASWEDEADPSRGLKLHDLQLDYVRARFVDRKALQLIHQAARLSAHVIGPNPLEFASQMVGRLLPLESNAAISDFIKVLSMGTPKPWLKPLWPSLQPPGTGLLRTLEGHRFFVRAVAMTPNGRLAVSASNDRTLKLWDVEKGAQLRTLAGHLGRVTAVAMTPDGRLAVSASEDKTLRLWDLESGAELHTLTAHSASVNGVAMTPDGRLAVSVSDDKTLIVWDLGSRTVIHTLLGHLDSIYGVAVSADGCRAVSASKDKTLKVWDLESGQVLHTLTGHLDSVNAATVTPDGRWAVSASDDKTLKLWNMETGQEIRSMSNSPHGVKAVGVTADGRRAVAASYSTLTVWDLQSGTAVHSFVGHSAMISGLAATPNLALAVSGSRDRTLKAWNLETCTQSLARPAHSYSITGVAVPSNRTCAVSVSFDYSIKAWNMESGQEIRRLGSHSRAVNGVTVTEDGKWAISASDDTTLKVWDLARGHLTRTLAGHADWVFGVAITPDGKRAVSASKDKTLKLWDVESGREIRTMVGHSDEVYSVALAPDGKRAVSASKDNALKIWDVESGKPVRTLVGHSDPVLGVALAEIRGWAVSASVDRTVKIWNLETGEEVRTLTGHSDWVRAVAVTADGNRAVSASDDKMIKVWQLSTGLLLAQFTCDAGVRCCAFVGPDKIIAGDDAGRLHLLTLEVNPPR